MANCNKLFLDFNQDITPTLAQMQAMKKSRVTLEEKISKKIMDKLGASASFYTQGSGAPRMKTIIIKSDGTYDADRGVYLPSKPEEAAETVQKYVLDAVKDHTDEGAQHRKKCIRVIYKSAYNIDFPVYYEVSKESYSYLAIKGNGWIKDDPSKMIDWFIGLKDEDGQLLRIVKYLKAWVSETSWKFKMPSGIALTVWAARNFEAVENRDDKCLLKVIQAIQRQILFSVTCTSPVEPFDDLTAKLNDDQKNKFRTELNNFCLDAGAAIDLNNQLQASKLWRKYFGDRFKEGLNEDVDKKANSLFTSASAILAQNAMLNRQGQINQESGTYHRNHRNYGG